MSDQIERRYIGNFDKSEKSDPNLLRVERRAAAPGEKPKTYIVGYAAVFDKNSLMLGDFYERIDPDAFELVEERTDGNGLPLETRCLFNHDPNHLLGRFPTTMRLTIDEKGLKYECLLPESRADIAESIERGDLKGSSFSFIVADEPGSEQWTTERGESVRIVKKIKSLPDCGPVTYPAYADSSVAVAKRSYDKYMSEQRAFCPTGKGGGIDNSCSGASIGSSVNGFLEFLDDVGIGAVAGGFVGSLGGGAGALVGGALGAVIGAITRPSKMSRENEAQNYEAFKKNTGIDDDKLIAVSSALKSKGEKTLYFATDSGKEVAIEFGSNIAMIRADGAKPSLYVAFSDNKNSPIDPKPLKAAAKAVGAGSVVVEVFYSKNADKLKAGGFEQKITGDEYMGGGVFVYEPKKKSSRSQRLIELEKRALQLRDQIKAEARNDCGRDESGKFGSGNKCQDEGEGPKTFELKKLQPKAFEPKNLKIKGNVPSGRLGKPKGEYMEVAPDDVKAKIGEMQAFADRAREKMKDVGKDNGAKDDGGGVQTWSKGDHHPWTIAQKGDSSTGGYAQGKHPDGSKTKKYPFKKGEDGSEAHKAVEAELKAKKKDKRSYDELMRFYRARAK